MGKNDITRLSIYKKVFQSTSDFNISNFMSQET